VNAIKTIIAIIAVLFVSACLFSDSQKEQVVDVVEPCIDLDLDLEGLIVPCLTSDDIEECVKAKINEILPEYEDLEECIKASIIKIAIDKITEEGNS